MDIEASTDPDIYRNGDVYRRERDRIAQLLTAASAPQPDPLTEWIAFGRHNWLWQLRHWRERPDRRAP